MKGRSVWLPSTLGGNSRERTFPKWQFVRSSPTATQGRGLPSTPETVSEQDRTLTKSCTSGCCAHVDRCAVLPELRSTLEGSKLCADLRECLAYDRTEALALDAIQQEVPRCLTRCLARNGRVCMFVIRARRFDTIRYARAE
eukprot:238019-Pleurochrysis_carterae.AAC.1